METQADEATHERDVLAKLEGAATLCAEGRAVGYWLSRRVGAGGMAVAYFALRTERGQRDAALVKVMRPGVARSHGAMASLSMRKEARALARLGMSTPPCAHVVRLFDTGTLTVSFEGAPLCLPWIAMEYVVGGPGGVTLEARVKHCVRTTGEAFSPTRARGLLRDLAAGMSAVHDAGILHRDLKPTNLLCTDSERGDLFKLADFGVARPAEAVTTFSGFHVGTPGYAAPEQAHWDPSGMGPWTDVFAAGAVMFYALTGEPYFEPLAGAELLRAIRSGVRRSLRDCRRLCRALREDRSACERLDAALAAATSPATVRRPQTAREFARAVDAALPGARPA